MLLEKCSKRCDLMTSQNSENGVPVEAGVQLTVIREGNFWTSELYRFGVLLAVLRPKAATKGDQKSILKEFHNRAL